MGITRNQEQTILNLVQNYVTANKNCTIDTADISLVLHTRNELADFLSSLVEPEKKSKYIYSYSFSSADKAFTYSGIIRLDNPVVGATSLNLLKDVLSIRHRTSVSILHSLSFLGKHEIG